MRCAEHPGVETVLRCGKCDKPICPKCLVQTPVGARCKGCAQLRRLPMFEVAPSQYGLAIAAGSILSIVLGIAWAFFRGIPFLGFLIPLAVGYLIGEAISQLVNRKRSAGLQIIVGLSVFATYLFSGMLPILVNVLLGPGMILPLGTLVRVGASLVIGAFTNPYLLVMLGLGVYLGVSRVR